MRVSMLTEAGLHNLDTIISEKAAATSQGMTHRADTPALCPRHAGGEEGHTEEQTFRALRQAEGARARL